MSTRSINPCLASANSRENRRCQLDLWDCYMMDGGCDFLYNSSTQEKRAILLPSCAKLDDGTESFLHAAAAPANRPLDLRVSPPATLASYEVLGLPSSEKVQQADAAPAPHQLPTTTFSLTRGIPAAAVFVLFGIGLALMFARKMR